LDAEHHLAHLPDTLRHLIRRTAAFKTVLGIPTEAKRCAVTVEAIEEHFARLSQEIENVPAAFIFNVDESEFQKFVDSHEIQVVVPADDEQDCVEIPANRSEKRSMMLAAVSADGSDRKPMAIIQRKA
jgi:restriction endonuclease